MDEDKIKSVTEGLIKEGAIKGKILGGFFIPTTFTLMQEGTVRKFYSQNRYIEYSMLAKLQVSKPKEFIESVIGNDKGRHLTNFYISNDFISQAEG